MLYVYCVFLFNRTVGLRQAARTQQLGTDMKYSLFRPQNIGSHYGIEIRKRGLLHVRNYKKDVGAVRIIRPAAVLDDEAEREELAAATPAEQWKKIENISWRNFRNRKHK